MAQTKIDWTDKVWNPTTGCNQGCTYCYARKMAARLQKMGLPKYRNGFTPCCHSDELKKPLHWHKPARVFVDSMGDLFDPAIPDEFISSVIGIIAITPHLTYQILTKNAKRMKEFFSKNSHGECVAELIASHGDVFAGTPHEARAIYRRIGPGWPWLLPNLWLGVTITTQAEIRRWWHLYYTMAAHRFISFEPLHSSIRFNCIHCHGKGHYDDDVRSVCPVCKGSGETLDRVDWIICGGENGNKAIPLNPAIVRSLRDRSLQNNIPFFFKGWGTYIPSFRGISDELFGFRKACGPSPGKTILDGREWREFPEAMK